MVISTPLRRAVGVLGGNPLRHVVVVGSALITAAVAPVWGTTLTWMGWLSARNQFPEEGLQTFGEVLAPRRARQLYADGIWSGLWRVHGVSIAFTVIQLPVTLLAFAPAVLANFLLSPTRMLFASMELGMIIGVGIPVLLALMGGIIVGAQTMLAWRILDSQEPPYALGLVFRVVGASWRSTLADLPSLMSLGASLVALFAIGAGATYLMVTLSGFLELSPAGTQLILYWTGALVAVLLCSLCLESIAQWASQAPHSTLKKTQVFSFSGWLRSWLGSVFGWFADRGLLAVGAAATLALGGLVGLGALLTGQVFTSWVGLGWFTVTALVLVALHWTGRKS